MWLLARRPAAGCAAALIKDQTLKDACPEAPAILLSNEAQMFSRTGNRKEAAGDPQANDVLVKFWPRAKGVDDRDLEDIWRSEIRQLQRLAAVPGADDLFVHMVPRGISRAGGRQR
jgi:hypothetical protein